MTKKQKSGRERLQQDRETTGPSQQGPQSEPPPQRNQPPLDTMFEDSSGPPLHGDGEIRSNQQGLTNEAQHGAYAQGLKHRGRS